MGHSPDELELELLEGVFLAGEGQALLVEDHGHGPLVEEIQKKKISYIYYHQEEMQIIEKL